METGGNKKKTKMLKCIIKGFVIGVIAGLTAAYIFKDFTLWLCVGCICGIALGIASGSIYDYWGK